MKKTRRFRISTLTAVAATQFTPKAAPVPALEEMGRYYIRDAAPMKGGHVDTQTGKGLFLLRCYRMSEHLAPKTIRNMVLRDERAVYIAYHGQLSRNKGDGGLVLGYIYDCEGTQRVSAIRAQGLDSLMMVQTTPTCLPSPTIAFDTDKPTFGVFAHLVQTPEDQLRRNCTITASDTPQTPRLSCL